MRELGIKKSKYYEILKDLGIKASKDSTKKSYLTFEQAESVRTYLLDHIQPSENEDSGNSSIVKASDSNLAAQANNNTEENNIYVQKEEPTASVDSDIVREAKELAARGMAMNDLLKIQLASKMTFDDLDSDLQEKVNIAREVANPKWTPAELADKLLAQHRQQKAQAQG